VRTRIVVEGTSDETSYRILLERCGFASLDIVSVGRSGPAGNASLLKGEIVRAQHAQAYGLRIDRLVLLKDSDDRSDAEMGALFAEATRDVEGAPEIRCLWIHAALESLFLQDWPAVLDAYGLRDLPMPQEPRHPKLVIEWLLTSRGEDSYDRWRSKHSRTVRVLANATCHDRPTRNSPCALPRPRIPFVPD